MAEYLIQDTTAQSIIDKVKTKAGITDDITGSEVEDAIDSILTPIDGTIPTKTSSNLTASGATVTVPAGYYAVKAEKSVSTASRANTTISVTADDTKDTLTITASNNQSTGYVTGANKTATTTITLTANGSSVTASDGSKSVSKSVSTATLATPQISVNPSTGVITSTVTQSTAGYISANSSKSNTKSMSTHSGGTYGPNISGTIVSAGTYVTGNINLTGASLYLDRSASVEIDSDYIYVYPYYPINTSCSFGFSVTLIQSNSSYYRMVTICSYNASRCQWYSATCDPVSGGNYLIYDSSLEYFNVYDDYSGSNYLRIPNPIGSSSLEEVMCSLTYVSA